MRVECGADSTFALGADGEVFSWGLNLKGELGHGNYKPVNCAAQLKYLASSGEARSPRTSKKPKDDDAKLSYGERVIDVSCGALHSLLLTSKGRIFCCGYGETHALGLGRDANQCTFGEIPYFSSGDFYDKPVTKIATGTSHSACVAGDIAYIWGVWGSRPQMVYTTPTPVMVGSPSNPESVIQVKLGDLLSAFLTSKGEVFTMGDNICGQLGIGDDVPLSTSPSRVMLEGPAGALAVGSHHVFAYSRETKTAYAWGSNLKGQISPDLNQNKVSHPMRLAHLTGISKIVCSSRATIGVSRYPVEFKTHGAEERVTGETIKKLESALITERTEKENYKRIHQSISNDNAQLRAEIQQLRVALTAAERSPTRKPLSIAVGTQTAAETEELEGMVDVMQHFKNKLKEDRTLRPCFEIDFSELVMEKQIGEGGFGLIYRARWRETTVAVKVLRPEVMREDTIKDFLSKVCLN